ncbi:MAG: hypothetical protein P1U87_05050 [Verrucomicrobiales bacterium]|nr:hypothetical protein [Verrucomicrobiales bacterium]
MPPYFPRFVFPALPAILLAATRAHSQKAELGRADKLLAAFQEQRPLLLKPIVDLEDSFQVSLNGVVRAQGKGSISLSPGAGSVLTLDKFEVRAPVE